MNKPLNNSERFVEIELRDLLKLKQSIGNGTSDFGGRMELASLEARERQLHAELNQLSHDAAISPPPSSQ